MEESTEARALDAEKQPFMRLFPWKDITTVVVIIVVVVGLALFLAQRLILKRETDAAKVVSNQVIAAISKQDTARLRALGDASFQKDNSTATLNDRLTFKTKPPITFAGIYGKTTPTTDQTFVTNNPRGQHVTVVYRYNTLKIPFFVRVDTIKPPHSTHWYLQALSASPNESSLLTVVTN